MGTFELLIVFAALMAVISLVAIAIDWVGRPLKNRRFIPRIYRYDDEISPHDSYELHTPAAPVVAAGPPHAPVAPVTFTPPPAMATTLAPPPASMAPASPPIVKPATATVAADLAPRPPKTDADAADAVASPAVAPSRTSAFQDSIAGVRGDNEASGATLSRPRGIAETVHGQRATAWSPDMPLDARVNDANPTPDEKAQRYWMATAHGVGDTTHFDDVNLARMAQGKAPTRRNPRSGDVEAMDLVGLRAASHRSDVRMKWPDETVDPWSAS